MPLGSCAASAATSRETRRLLHMIGEAVSDTTGATRTPIDHAAGDWPDDCPDLETSVTGFVPTAVRFSDPGWDDEPILSWDDDHVSPSRFLTSVFAADDIAYLAWGKIKTFAARAYLQPPVPPADGEERALLMARHGKGVPLLAEDGHRSHHLTRRLGGLERALFGTLSPADQVAVVAMLAAGGGAAAFVSADGDWPRHQRTLYLADSLGVTVHRFSFAGVPDEVVDQLHHGRYYARGRDRGD